MKSLSKHAYDYSAFRFIRVFVLIKNNEVAGKVLSVRTKGGAVGGVNTVVTFKLIGQPPFTMSTRASGLDQIQHILENVLPDLFKQYWKISYDSRLTWEQNMARAGYKVWEVTD